MRTRRARSEDPAMQRFAEIMGNPEVIARSAENLAAIDAAVAHAAETLIGKGRETV